MQKRDITGLRPWKPGVSGNPRGRPREISNIVAVMPREEFAELVWILFKGTVADWVRISRSKTRPSLQVIIARALVRDTRRGEIKNLNRLLNHIIGYPKTVFEYRVTCAHCGASRTVPGPSKAR